MECKIEEINDAIIKRLNDLGLKELEDIADSLDREVNKLPDIDELKSGYEVLLSKVGSVDALYVEKDADVTEDTTVEIYGEEVKLADVAEKLSDKSGTDRKEVIKVLKQLINYIVKQKSTEELSEFVAGWVDYANAKDINNEQLRKFYSKAINDKAINSAVNLTLDDKVVGNIVNLAEGVEGVTQYKYLLDAVDSVLSRRLVYNERIYNEAIDKDIDVENEDTLADVLSIRDQLSTEFNKDYTARDLDKIQTLSKELGPKLKELNVEDKADLKQYHIRAIQEHTAHSNSDLHGTLDKFNDIFKEVDTVGAVLHSKLHKDNQPLFKATKSNIDVVGWNDQVEVITNDKTEIYKKSMPITGLTDVNGVDQLRSILNFTTTYEVTIEQIPIHKTDITITDGPSVDDLQIGVEYDEDTETKTLVVVDKNGNKVGKPEDYVINPLALLKTADGKDSKELNRLVGLESVSVMSDMLRFKSDKVTLEKLIEGLGLDSNTPTYKEVMKYYTSGYVPMKLFVQNAGQNIYKNLGLKLADDVDKNVEDRLITALGTLAVDRVKAMSTKLDINIQGGPKKLFITTSIDEETDMNVTSTQLVDDINDENVIINHSIPLFKVPSVSYKKQASIHRAASNIAYLGGKESFTGVNLTPPKDHILGESKVQGTQTLNSDKVVKSLNKRQHQPYYISDEIKELLKGKNKEDQVELLNRLFLTNTTTLENLAVDKLESTLATQEMFKRGIIDFVDAYNIIKDKAFYLKWKFVKDARAQIDDNKVNPMANKLTRFFTHMTDTATTIKRSKEDDTLDKGDMVLYKLAIAQTLDMDPDKKADSSVIADLEKNVIHIDDKGKINIIDPSLNKLYDAVKENNTKVMAEELQKHGQNERAHVFSMVHSLIKLEDSVENSTDFSHTLALESDGITSGMILMLMQIGSKRSWDLLTKGGVYKVNVDYGGDIIGTDEDGNVKTHGILKEKDNLADIYATPVEDFTLALRIHTLLRYFKNDSKANSTVINTLKTGSMKQKKGLVKEYATTIDKHISMYEKLLHKLIIKDNSSKWRKVLKPLVMVYIYGASVGSIQQKAAITMGADSLLTYFADNPDTTLGELINKGKEDSDSAERLILRILLNGTKLSPSFGDMDFKIPKSPKYVGSFGSEAANKYISSASEKAIGDQIVRTLRLLDRKTTLGTGVVTYHDINKNTPNGDSKSKNKQTIGSDTNLKDLKVSDHTLHKAAKDAYFAFSAPLSYSFDASFGFIDDYRTQTKIPYLLNYAYYKFKLHQAFEKKGITKDLKTGTYTISKKTYNEVMADLTDKKITHGITDVHGGEISYSKQVRGEYGKGDVVAVNGSLYSGKNTSTSGKVISSVYNHTGSDKLSVSTYSNTTPKEEATNVTAVGVSNIHSLDGSAIMTLDDRGLQNILDAIISNTSKQDNIDIQTDYHNTMIRDMYKYDILKMELNKASDIVRQLENAGETGAFIEFHATQDNAQVNNQLMRIIGDRDLTEALEEISSQIDKHYAEKKEHTTGTVEMSHLYVADETGTTSIALDPDKLVEHKKGEHNDVFKLLTQMHDRVVKEASKKKYEGNAEADRKFIERYISSFVSKDSKKTTPGVKSKIKEAIAKTYTDLGLNGDSDNVSYNNGMINEILKGCV
jgi:hypothetical protein